MAAYHAASHSYQWSRKGVVGVDGAAELGVVGDQIQAHVADRQHRQPRGEADAQRDRQPAQAHGQLVPAQARPDPRADGDHRSASARYKSAMVASASSTGIPRPSTSPKTRSTSSGPSVVHT